MKTTKSLMALISLMFALPASADCEYKGKTYKTYTGPETFIAQEWSEDMYPEHTKDAYALVITCMPVLDIEKIGKEGWSLKEIPAVKDVWTFDEGSYLINDSDVTLNY